MARFPMQTTWVLAAATCSVLLLFGVGRALAQQNLRQQTCSRDQTATIQQGSSAWLGGIISLSSSGTGGYGCGGPIGSMQAYEALRWVLDVLNKKDEKFQGEMLLDYYVPGIPLGLKMKNYCRNELSAQAAVVDIFPELGGDSETCSESSSNLTLGIIGASTSAHSMAISDATAPYGIPVVSYESTAMQLTAPGMYTNFMRTVSPDGPMMEVIVKVLTKLQWHHLIIVYDQGPYGSAAYSELHTRLVAAGICLTSAIEVNDQDISTAGATLDRVVSAGMGRDQTSDNLTATVFFGSPAYAQALVKEGNTRLPQAGHLQWLFVDFPADATFEVGSVYQRGIISITAASRFIVEFEDHWIRIDENDPSPENPWFQSWFEDRHDCRFTPVGSQKDCSSVYPGATRQAREELKRSVYQQDQDVEAAVMAVYTYARALRTAQMAKCGNVPGVCAALRAMTRQEFHQDYLKKVDFTFTATERVPSLASKNVLPYNAAKHLKFTEEGDVTDPSYFIYNYNNLGADPTQFAFRQVGSFIDNHLDMSVGNVAIFDSARQMRLEPAPSSSCPLHRCGPCLGLPADINYYYQPGDLVINGIFSLHQVGATPLTCGAALSPNQYQYLEAMIYAVQKVNSDPSILPNVRLGGLGLDDCSSDTLGQSFLAQVQRGNLVINDPAGNALDPLTIEAYTAAHTSPLTLPLAEAMNMLRRPMVGYRAASSELDDASRFPYYLRAVPGISDEIRAIILLLKKFDWMFVQVVVSPDHYSTDAEKVFRDLGAKAGICIVARHNIGTTPAQVEGALAGIKLNPTTHPVVVLLDTGDYRRLLQGLASVQGIQVGSSFAFVATSRLGTDKAVVKGYETVANKIVSLSYKHSSLVDFQAYLRGLDSATYRRNPWFREWFQAVHGCTLTPDGVAVSCDLTKSVVEGTNFDLLFEVDSVINAVQAIAQGLDATLAHYCGDGYTSVCAQFLNAPDKGEQFLQRIRTFVRSFERPFEINRYDYDAARNKNEFSLVGEVNPWTNEFSLTTALAIPMSNTAPMCPTPCLECLYMFNHLDYTYIPGDLVIAGIFDEHFRGSGPFNCDVARDDSSARYTEAFKFALQHVNSGSSSVQLKVKLGGLLFDGCSNPPRSTAIINRVHTGMDIRDGDREFKPRELLAWLTYDSQTTIEAAGLVRSLGTPIVSPAATARELDDKVEYPTFFRTIPSDSVVVKGMAEFVREMGWMYVVSLNAPDVASRESRDYFRELLAGFGICVTASYEFETDGSMEVIYNSISAGDTQVVAVFAEPDRHIEEFLKARRAGVKNLIFVANRPWGKIAERYNDVTSRSVSFSLADPAIAEYANYLSSAQLSTSEWGQDIWTLPTINAVYSLAEGLHTTLKEKCGDNYNSLCQNFLYDSDVHKAVMRHMDAAKFTDIAGEFFEFIQREANRGFRVERYTALGTPQLQGSLDLEGAITLSDKAQLLIDYADVESGCPGDCLQCSSSSASMQDFTLIQGDVYIVGLFDVHKKGSTPFTCGDINDKHGLPLLEAFNYAIEYVNEKKGIFRDLLPGIQLGGIGLDTCQSPSRAANLVANIHSGNVQLRKAANMIIPRRIEAYVGPMETESTLRVANILTQLAIPQISYGATGVDLLDMDRYRYFLRSVPADDKQARAIISFLKKFQYNNIQFVSSFDEIGEPGREEFFKLALVNKICVKIEYLAGEGGDPESDAAGIVSQIAQQSDAQVVVLWMKNPIPVLEAASAHTIVSQRFQFVVTDKWGADPEVLENPNVKTLLTNRKLIVLDVETADIPLFDEYLETKTPDNYNRNPWFKDYFEAFQKCYWDSPSGTRLTACDKSSTIPRADHYVQDPYVLYVVNAVFSVAEGIDKAVKELCTFNNNYVRGACDLYLTSGERRQEVMKGLKKVNFTDDTHQPFFYTEDGQSDRGFHIYNVTNVDGPNSPFRYENVGSYNDTHFLKLDITYAPTVSAHCDADRTDPSVRDCVCEFPPDIPSRYMLKEDGGRGLTLVYVGDVHQPHPTNPLACGHINTGPDLQKLLAFFYAIDRINSNSDFTMPDSVKLDGLALDSCTHGLRLGQDVYNVLSGNPLCDSDRTKLLVSPSSITAFIVDQDHNALPLSAMLNQQRITTISPTASLTQLQNEMSHPYFLSTRGDYAETARAILDTAAKAKWNLMSVIYTDTMAHRSAKEAILAQSYDASMCVGDSVPLGLDATLEDAKAALERLSAQMGARAVALFVEPPHLRLLLQASQALGLTGRFVWLVPTKWAYTGEHIRGLEAEVAGSLLFEARSAILEDFNRYIRSISFTNRHGIPEDWFRDIYETVHQCNLLNQQMTGQGRRFSRVCTEEEVVTADSPLLSQDPAVLHVILSVNAAALGLTNIPNCQLSNLDLAACLQLTGDERNVLIRDGVADVEFDVLPELLGNKTFKFAFDQFGASRLGLVISNYQASSGDSNYIRMPLGSYADGELDLDMTQYAARNLYTRGTLPGSDCAMGSQCQCQLPGGRSWTYAPEYIMDSSLIRVGGRYNDPDTGEVVVVNKIPNTGDRFDDTWAIIVTILACIGAVVSLGVFLYLLVMYPVRGGTSILGFMLSFGIVLLYLTALAFIAHASRQICGLRRFSLGVVYAFVYSCLLVKLVDCWRVRGKDDSYPAKYSKLGRPVGLFLVTIFLVLVQVMINAEWLILREPSMVRIFYHDQYWPRCTPEDFYDEGLVLSLCYVMVLIVVSLGLALLTFTTKNNHRESRWILGILVLSVPIWVIWCTASVLGTKRVRDAAVAIGLIVTATVMLLLVPVRKLYLLHKYNVLLEEEEEAEEEARSHIAASQRGDYNSVYGRQYDNRGDLHDSGSVHGSTRGYGSRIN